MSTSRRGHITRDIVHVLNSMLHQDLRRERRAHRETTRSRVGSICDGGATTRMAATSHRSSEAVRPAARRRSSMPCTVIAEVSDSGWLSRDGEK